PDPGPPGGHPAHSGTGPGRRGAAQPAPRRRARTGVPRQLRRLPRRGGARRSAAGARRSPGAVRRGRPRRGELRSGGDVDGPGARGSGSVRRRRPWPLVAPAVALVVVFFVHLYLPFMVLSPSGTLETIPPDLGPAARSLGASAVRAFWRVVFPLSLPGVFAGCLLVFVLAVSSYVIPVLLGGFKVLTTP